MKMPVEWICPKVIPSTSILIYQIIYFTTNINLDQKVYIYIYIKEELNSSTRDNQGTGKKRAKNKKSDRKSRPNVYQ